MNKVFSTLLNEKAMHAGLLIYRIVISGFMLVHGIPKLMKLFSSDPIKFSDPLGIGITSSLLFTVLAEFGCSILIIIGLGTRIAAAGLAFTMIIAAFVVHSEDAFDKKEKALLYLVIYLFLFIAGPGKYSVDRALSTRKG